MAAKPPPRKPQTAPASSLPIIARESRAEKHPYSPFLQLTTSLFMIRVRTHSVEQRSLLQPDLAPSAYLTRARIGFVNDFGFPLVRQHHHQQDAFHSGS